MNPPPSRARNAAEMVPVLQGWQRHMLAADAQISEAQAFGLRVESPLIQAVFELKSALTASVAAQVGDSVDGWLEWWWLENAMGKRGLEASSSIAGKMRPIRTLKQLARLIAAGSDQQ